MATLEEMIPAPVWAAIHANECEKADARVARACIRRRNIENELKAPGFARAAIIRMALTGVGAITGGAIFITGAHGNPLLGLIAFYGVTSAIVVWGAIAIEVGFKGLIVAPTHRFRLRRAIKAQRKAEYDAAALRMLHRD